VPFCIMLHIWRN